MLSRNALVVADSLFILGLSATVGPALFALVVHSQHLSTGLLIILLSVLAIIAIAPWGVTITYINERFATEVRSSGFRLGFSVIPSFYAFFVEGLGHIVPTCVAPLTLLAIGGLLGAMGTFMKLEIKNVDL